MPIRKLRNQTQLSIHSLDIAAQRRNQQISPLLDARDVLLFDPEFLGDTDLSPLPRLAQVLQGHLFSNQLRRARLDLLSARLRQFIHPLLQRRHLRSEEHTSELQSLMRISYAVFCLKKKNKPP